jgi:hypothetical protein
MSESLTALALSDPAAASRLRRQKAAEALMAQGMEATPIRAHSQGLARMAQALMGGLELGQIERETRDESRRLQDEAAAYDARFAPQQAAEASAPQPAPTPQAAAPQPAPAPPAAPQAGFRGSVVGSPAPAGGGMYGRNVAMVADREAAMEGGPEALAARSAAVAAQRSGLPTGPVYRSPAGVGGAFVGLPPPNGGVPVLGAQGAPQPDAAPPRPTGINMDLATLLREGFNSRNPAIRRRAETELKLAELTRKDTAPGPTVTMDGPQGPGIYERTPTGLRFVGKQAPAQEAPDRTLVEVRNPDGSSRFVPRSQAAGMTNAPPRETTDADTRRQNHYIDLTLKAQQGPLSQQEQLTLDLLTRQLLGREQIAVGPSGVAVVAPPPLPGVRPQGGGGLATPAGNSPITQLAVPAEDAGRLPVPGQKPPISMTTPGGRQVTMQPAEPAPPSGYERGPDGTTLQRIPGGPADPAGSPLNEGQGKANMFGIAMKQANAQLAGAEVPSGAAIAAWRNLPDGVVNMGLSPGAQKYFNAVRAFAAGILRKETGASFGANELADVQSRFFPVQGDGPEVVKQKAAARAQAIASMQAEVPGGFRGEIPGATNKPPISSVDALAAARAKLGANASDDDLVAEARRLRSAR